MLYRFKIELSDISRSLYESIDVRAAQHPSETSTYLVTRVLAYALNYEPGLAFKEGLNNPDEPCLSMPDARGGERLWIEIGNPSGRKLHKAAKASKEVKVYTYKSAESLLKEMEGVYRAKEIQVFSFAPDFLEALSSGLVRENRWNLIYDEGSLLVDNGAGALQTEIQQHFLEGV